MSWINCIKYNKEYNHKYIRIQNDGTNIIIETETDQINIDKDILDSLINILEDVKELENRSMIRVGINEM